MPLPEVSPVCEEGQLELSCTITGSLLNWTIIPGQNQSGLKVQSNVATSNRSFMYGDSTISILRISHPMQLTSSRIAIRPIYNDFDGVGVICTDIENHESSSTAIIVVNAQGM